MQIQPLYRSQTIFWRRGVHPEVLPLPGSRLALEKGTWEPPGLQRPGLGPASSLPLRLPAAAVRGAARSDTVQMSLKPRVMLSDLFFFPS